MINSLPPNPFPPSTADVERASKDIAHLQTEIDELASAKANKSTIAPSFSSETSYEVGNIVYYNGVTYICTTAHTGAWDANDFETTTVASQIENLREDVSDVESDVTNLGTTKANQITIAPSFSDSVAYDIGDIVYYNGLSYICTNTHEGEWDADDFTPTTVAFELSSLKSGLTNVTNVTVTTNHQSITTTVIYAKKLGKILLVSGYFYIAAGEDITKDELLLTVDQSILSDVFTSSVSSSGDPTRLKMATDGKIYTEHTFKADRFYSFELVAFTN